MSVSLESNELRGVAVRRLVWGGAVFLMLLPAVAMQFTDEVDWTGADFVAWGVMLAVACLAYEVAARIARSNAYMAAAGIAVGGGFLTVWANLAVGIIGNEDNPANLLFFGVVLFAAVGSLLMLFRARGMAWVMAATAAVQLAVCLYAWLAGIGIVFVYTAVMCLLWMAASRLFRRAAETGSGSLTDAG
jgi:hypothetical protein